jgi:hypothetical protein
MLSTTPDHIGDPGLQSGTSSKKRNKRTRGYEGDEVFNRSKSVLFPSATDGKICLMALSGTSELSSDYLASIAFMDSPVLHMLLRHTNIATAARSVAARILLAAHLGLPQATSASVSDDPTFYDVLSRKLCRVCSDLAIGTTGTLSKSLALVATRSKVFNSWVCTSIVRWLGIMQCSDPTSRTRLIHVSI